MNAHHEQYLVGLDLAGRRAVVVGGGQVAQRRVARLIAAGAVVEVVSPEVTPAVEGMASAGEITWTARRWTDGDLAGAWYAIAATDEENYHRYMRYLKGCQYYFIDEAIDVSLVTYLKPALAA